MVTQINGTNNYQGLSTDDKPIITNSNSNATFYSIDTGDAWFYDGHNINPITSNNWWEV